MATARSHFHRVVLAVVLVGGFLSTTIWIADPLGVRAGGPPFESYPDSYLADAGGTGGPQSPDLEAAVVFVIDSSDSMSPRVGPSYFDLARDALVKLLERPLIPSTGALMIGIVQNPPPGAADYYPMFDYFPLHVTDSDWRNAVLKRLRILEPSQHSSADLLESGIHHAHEYLKNFDPGIKRHIVLLTTGEYRFPCNFYSASPGTDDVPYTCPPVAYLGQGDNQNPAWDPIMDPCMGETTDDGPDHPCGHDNTMRCNCNRACSIRYRAWKARKEGITVSAVRLGPEWDRAAADHRLCPGAAEPPADETCETDIPSPVSTPNRGDLLREIINHGRVGQPPDWSANEPCTSNQPVGEYTRLNPFFCHDCYQNKQPIGSAVLLEKTLASWLCTWMLPEAPCDPLHPQPADVDCDTVHNMCDICTGSNDLDADWGGRDCDRDQVGDRCQYADLPDADNDGVADGVAEQCPGGDDCLIAEWREAAGCGIPGLPDRPECDCDCDNNGIPDFCSTAQELAGNANACESETPPPACSGIPDLCNAAAQAGGSDPIFYKEDFSGDINPDPDIVEEWAVTQDDGTLNLIEQSEAQPFDRKAWWMHPHDVASTRKHAQIVSVPGPGDPANPEAWIRVLELSQDTSRATDGTYRWFVEGPGIRLPEETMCEWTTGDCQSSSCDEVDPGEWGVIAVELQLYIDNELGGTSYDVYIMEPCIEDEESAKRVHLRFQDDTAAPEPDPNKGTIYYERFAYGGWSSADLAFASTGLQYPTNAWFKVLIVLDRSQHYQIMETTESCPRCPSQRAAQWESPFVDSSVNVFVRSDLTSLFTYNFSEQLPELGPPRKGVNRGIQVRFASNNQSCDCSQYGNDTAFDFATTTGVLLENSKEDRLASQLRGEVCDSWQDGFEDCHVPCSPPQVCAVDECWIDWPILVFNWMTANCANWRGASVVGFSPENLCGVGAPIECSIPDCEDNCPGIENPWQRDSDLDGWGDACDGFYQTNPPGDTDPQANTSDGVYGMFDNCPRIYNPARPYVVGSLGPDSCVDQYWHLPNGYMWQPDRDCDGIGDPCDTSADSADCSIACCGDTLHLNMNLFNDWNSADCEGSPFRDPDSDHRYGDDNCPYHPSAASDNDLDGIGQWCDNCDACWNPDQSDRDMDGIGDACDEPDGCPGNWQWTFSHTPDFTGNEDNDGQPDYLDNCPLEFNLDQLDSDRDGLGDDCDSNTILTDCDGDGRIDQQEIECLPFPTAVPECNNPLTTEHFCNPCKYAACAQYNVNHCMCLSPGLAFMHDKSNVGDLFDGILENGVAPTVGGPKGHGMSCMDIMRVKSIEIRQSNRCEWSSGVNCPAGTRCDVCNVSCVTP